MCHAGPADGDAPRGGYQDGWENVEVVHLLVGKVLIIPAHRSNMVAIGPGRGAMSPYQLPALV